MKWSFTWSTRAIHLHSILVFLSQLKFWFAKKLKMNLRIAWQKRAFVNYQCGIQNSPRQSANAEAFAKAYLCFLVSASAKKMLRQLNDNDDVFQTNSNLFSWGRSFTILSTYFCILFPHFCCSLISVSMKPDIERILTLPYSHKW